jgi:hypothetical protein
MRRHQPGTVRTRKILADPTRHGHANNAVEILLDANVPSATIITSVQAAASYQLIMLRLFLF